MTDSPGSAWALAWAVGAARQHHASLTVLVAFLAHPPGRWRWTLLADRHAIAAALVHSLFAEVCGGPPAGVPVQVTYVADTPGRALTAAANAGDLLLIGAGGRGPTRGRTRRFCGRRARCPVVIVPRPDVGDLLRHPAGARTGGVDGDGPGR